MHTPFCCCTRTHGVPKEHLHVAYSARIRIIGDIDIIIIIIIIIIFNNKLYLEYYTVIFIFINNIKSGIDVVLQYS